MKREGRLSINMKRILSIIALVVVLTFSLIAVFVFSPNLLSIVEDPMSFRIWVEEHGAIAKLAALAMIALKVIFPILPGKPFEVCTGYAFGSFEGTILVVTGAALGSYIVFGLVRVFGVKIFDLFYPHEKFLSMKFLHDTERLSVWVFFIMLIPGTPKDFLSYCVGLTNMKFKVWAIISPLARIPVTLMATLGGSALGTQDYLLAIIIFAASALTSVVGLLVYKQVREAR